MKIRGMKKSRCFKNLDFFITVVTFGCRKGCSPGDLGDLGDFFVGFILTSAGLVATWVTLAAGEGQWDGHAQQQ